MEHESISPFEIIGTSLDYSLSHIYPLKPLTYMYIYFDQMYHILANLEGARLHILLAGALSAPSYALFH